MKEIMFVDRVKKHFDFLETKYKFRIVDQSNSDVRPRTDGIVEYMSNMMAVVVDSETGFAAVWFYRIKDGRRYELDPVAINEYLNTSDEEKKLLLSTDPKDFVAALNLFNQKLLLNQPGWRVETDEIEEKLDLRLANYASWLETHGALCLENNLLEWVNFYEYKVKRARADHLRRGKDELGYIRMKDVNGNSKLVRQSIFQEKLEHVERLKQEL